MLLNDIEDQIKDLFTGNELISLTNNFANSVGEQVTFQGVGFNSKKDIISRNVSDLSDEAKINFFESLMEIRRVREDPELIDQINRLINSGDQNINEARNSMTKLLDKYPDKIGNIWANAVNSYDNSDYRNSLDSMRLTVELLLKSVLGNEKSLENQKRPLGSFLERKGISSQFRNLFFRTLDMYEKIQNNEVKHDVPDNLGKTEIRFLMNQAVIIIRFIDQINNEAK